MEPVSEFQMFTSLLEKGKSCHKSFLLLNSANLHIFPKEIGKLMINVSLQGLLLFHICLLLIKSALTLMQRFIPGAPSCPPTPDPPACHSQVVQEICSLCAVVLPLTCDRERSRQPDGTVLVFPVGFAPPQLVVSLRCRGAQALYGQNHWWRVNLNLPGN